MTGINQKALLAVIANLTMNSNQGLKDSWIGLFNGTPIQNRGQNLTALQEAIFEGYQRVPFVPGQILTLPDGAAAVVGQRCQFVANSGLANPQVISGYFQIGGAGNITLLTFALFDEPVSVSIPGASVNINPSAEFKFDTNYGDLPGPQP